ATDVRARALLLLAAFTGLRSSELRGLRWADVDLKKGEIHVRQRADKYREIGDPKSEGSRRSVPLDLATVGDALKQWKLKCDNFESAFLFPKREGGQLIQEFFFRCWPPSWVTRAFGTNTACIPSAIFSPLGASMSKRTAGGSCRRSQCRHCSGIPPSL